MSAPVVSRLVDELVNRYRDLGPAALRREIDDAVHDLSRSVHPDALAEMAIRLTLARLGSARTAV